MVQNNINQSINQASKHSDGYGSDGPIIEEWTRLNIDGSAWNRILGAGPNRPLWSRRYSTRVCLKVCAPRFCFKSLCSPMLFGGWLIDWVNVAGTPFPFFLENHCRFGLHFCFIRRMITMPIGRQELAEFGRFVAGKYRFLKCADFEAYPYTKMIREIRQTGKPYGLNKLNKETASIFYFGKRKWITPWVPIRPFLSIMLILIGWSDVKKMENVKIF